MLGRDTMEQYICLNTGCAWHYLPSECYSPWLDVPYFVNSKEHLQTKAHAPRFGNAPCTLTQHSGRCLCLAHAYLLIV